MEPSAQADILASQSTAAVQREGYTPLVVLADQTAATGRRPDGACVYLTPETLCSLHGELGGGRKPLACQLYPYSLTATPDGYFASLSFACPVVVEGRDGNLQANRQELEGLLAERGGPAQVAHQVEVLAGVSVPWESYLELEKRLHSAFQPGDPVNSLLNAAVGVTQAVQASNPWPDFTQVTREEAFDLSLLAMFSASVIALWELPNAPQQRQAFSQALLQGEELRSDRHALTLPRLDFLPADQPLLRETFQRYWENAIFGKSLLAGPVVSRLLTLACGFALTLYYAEAFRQQAGAEQVDLQALIRAFELVEADLVSHTRSADPLFLAFESTLQQAYQ